MKKHHALLTVIVLLCTPHLSLATQPPVVSWDMLKQLNYKTGSMPNSLQQLNNHMIEASGFIVPLEQGYYLDTVKTFLLVPNPLACIHIPPPAPNQMIYVDMKEEIPLDMDFRGVSIIGRITISPPNDSTDSVRIELIGFSAKEADIDFEFDDDFEFIDPFNGNDPIDSF